MKASKLAQRLGLEINQRRELGIRSGAVGLPPYSAAMIALSQLGTAREQGRAALRGQGRTISRPQGCEQSFLRTAACAKAGIPFATREILWMGYLDYI